MRGVTDPSARLRWSRLSVVMILAAHAQSARPCAAQSADTALAQIIRRAVLVQTRLTHYRVDEEQVDVLYQPDGNVPLPDAARANFAPFRRLPQADGALILMDRVRGQYEFLAPAQSWAQLTRIGGDGHSAVDVTDGQSRFSFLTRHPDSIVQTDIRVDAERAAAGDDKARSHFSVLTYRAGELDDARRSHTIAYGGREVMNGVLCDVIDVVHVGSPASDAVVPAADRARTTFYVGTSDAIIRRIVRVDSIAADGRRSYEEVNIVVDTTIAPSLLNYARFASTVTALIGHRPLPKIVFQKLAP